MFRTYHLTFSIKLPIEFSRLKMWLRGNLVSRKKWRRVTVKGAKLIRKVKKSVKQNFCIKNIADRKPETTRSTVQYKMFNLSLPRFEISKHNRLMSGELLSNDRLNSSVASHGLLRLAST